MMLQNAAAVQQGAVRIISLADQLTEMPLQSMTMPSPEWQWYQGPEAWGNMETPQKMMGLADMQFMQMETPAEKPMMPGHNMCQADESQLKVPESYMMPPEAICTQMETVPLESYVLPHRLFDSPEKASSEQGQTTPLREEHHCQRRARSEERRSTVLESGEAPESPRSRTQPQDSIGPLMSPTVRCLASPTPTTPKRQCYVPETPSPERMHCSWLQQAPALPYAQPMPTAGLPCYYGAHAMGGLVPHEQVMPDFLQMNVMPCLAPHEGQIFGDMVVQS